jgi:prevent-host-death family protein
MRRSSNSQDRPRKNTANVAEIKARFSSFLRQVAAGETVTVTNRDRPVARLVPALEEKDSVRIRKPLKDPAGLIGLLKVPPVKGRRTDSLKLLLEDRRKR